MVVEGRLVIVIVDCLELKLRRFVLIERDFLIYLAMVTLVASIDSTHAQVFITLRRLATFRNERVLLVISVPTRSHFDYAR